MLAITIPSACTHRRMLGGIYLEIALPLGVLSLMAAFLSLIYGGLLICFLALCLLCATIIPLWSFIAYQTKKDPQWGRVWLDHIKLKGYYYG
jgi:type IV secretory pathway TrbD component